MKTKLHLFIILSLVLSTNLGSAYICPGCGKLYEEEEQVFDKIAEENRYKTIYDPSLVERMLFSKGTKEWYSTMCSMWSISQPLIGQQIRSSLFDFNDIEILVERGIYRMKLIDFRVVDTRRNNTVSAFALLECPCRINNDDDKSPRNISALPTIPSAFNVPSSNICINGQKTYISQGTGGPNSFFIYALHTPEFQDTLEPFAAPETFIVIAHLQPKFSDVFYPPANPASDFKIII